MPLPKINTPTYELVLPSTGKKIKYRPFLVREEKILIMAMESEDMNQITSAIIQIISDCLLAKEFCEDRQWEFKVLTEDELGIR